MNEIMITLKDALLSVTLQDMLKALIKNAPYIIIGCLIYNVVNRRR